VVLFPLEEASASMIRITRQTDYGIVLMTHMAGNP